MEAVSRSHPRFREPALLLSHLENNPPGAVDIYPNASIPARLAQLRSNASTTDQQTMPKPALRRGYSPPRRVAFAQGASRESNPTSRSVAVSSITPLATPQRALTQAQNQNDDDEGDDEPKLFTVLSDSNVPPDPRTEFLVFRAPSVPQSVHSNSRSSSVGQRPVSPPQEVVPLRFSTSSPFRPVPQYIPPPPQAAFPDIDEVDDGDARSWGTDDDDRGIYDASVNSRSSINNDDGHDDDDDDDEDFREHSPMISYEPVAPQIAADWLSPPRLETVQHPWFDNSSKNEPTRPSARRGDKVFPSPLVKISYDAERHAAAEALKSPSISGGQKLYATTPAQDAHSKSLQKTPSSTSSLRGGIPLPRSGAPEPSPAPPRTAVMDLPDRHAIDFDVDDFLQNSSEVLLEKKEAPARKTERGEKSRNADESTRRDRSASLQRHLPNQSDPFALEDYEPPVQPTTVLPTSSKKKAPQSASSSRGPKDSNEQSSVDVDEPQSNRSKTRAERSKTPPLGPMTTVPVSASHHNTRDAASTPLQGEETARCLESVISSAGPMMQSEEESIAGGEPFESTSRRHHRHASLRERKESQRKARQQKREENAEVIAAQRPRRGSDDHLAFSIGSAPRHVVLPELPRGGTPVRAHSPPLEHYVVATVFQSGGSINMLKRPQSFSVDDTPNKREASQPQQPSAEALESSILRFQSGGNLKVASPARARDNSLTRDEVAKQEEPFVVLSGGSINLPMDAQWTDEYHSRGMLHIPKQHAEDEAGEADGATAPSDEASVVFQSGGNMSVISPSKVKKAEAALTEGATEAVSHDDAPVLMSAGSMRMPRSSLVYTVDDALPTPAPQSASARLYGSVGGTASERPPSVRSSSGRKRLDRTPDEFAAAPPPPHHIPTEDPYYQRVPTPVNTLLSPTASFQVGSTFRSSGSLRINMLQNVMPSHFGHRPPSPVAFSSRGGAHVLRPPSPGPSRGIASAHRPPSPGSSRGADVAHRPPSPAVSHGGASILRPPSPSIDGSVRKGDAKGTPRNSSRKLGTPLSRPRLAPVVRPPPAPERRGY